MNNLKTYIGFFIALSIIVFIGVMFFSSVVGSSAGFMAHTESINNTKMIDSLKTNNRCLRDSIFILNVRQQKIIKTLNARRMEIMNLDKQVKVLWERAK